jgi:hypothetical protein
MDGRADRNALIRLIGNLIGQTMLLSTWRLKHMEKDGIPCQETSAVWSRAQLCPLQALSCDSKSTKSELCLKKVIQATLLRNELALGIELEAISPYVLL